MEYPFTFILFCLVAHCANHHVDVDRLGIIDRHLRGSSVIHSLHSDGEFWERQWAYRSRWDEYRSRFQFRYALASHYIFSLTLVAHKIRTTTNLES